MSFRQPPKPAGRGAASEYARQQQDYLAHHGQLGHLSGAGDLTTKGFLPRRARKTPPSAPAGGECEQFAIVREYKDYVVGLRATSVLNGDDEGRSFTLGTEEVRIAKPFELRASPWDIISRGGVGTGPVDGFFYTYSNTVGLRTRTLASGDDYGAADSAITWTERIYPPYLFTTTPATQPDKRIIYAMEVKQGPLFRVTEAVDGVDTQFEITWVDLNSDGRYWRSADQKIKICNRGAAGAWFALFPASDAFQEE